MVQVTDLDRALGHELSDCLWALIARASRLGVDLEAAFIQTMDELDRHLTPLTWPVAPCFGHTVLRSFAEVLNQN